MKRSLITLAIGSLFAAPAFADYETGLKPNEIHPGVTYGQMDIFGRSAPTADKSRMQVRSNLREGETAFQKLHRARLDRTAQPPQLQQPADKTRAQVRAEVVELYRSGELIADNAELGKDWRM